MEKVLIIDGNSILNRAFYGVRPLTAKDGFPTNALYGLVSMIDKQFESVKPDYCAVAFDLKSPTFRHKMYKEYKAGRSPMPEELAKQFPVARELLTAMGYKILSLSGFEADDILGTVAHWSEKNDKMCYVMTGDRDSLQLITDKTHVLLATNKETIDMDRDRFFAEYGVEPSEFVDVKALMGDSSDNIPGVRGIGQKGALKLIAEYGNIESIYCEFCPEDFKPAEAEKLEEGKESAFLSKELSRIFCDVPLNCTLEDLKYNGIHADDLQKLFLRLDFTAFLKKYHLDAIQQSIPMPELLPACDIVSLEYTDGHWISYDGKRRCTVENLPDFLQNVKAEAVAVYDCKTLAKCPDGYALNHPKTFDVMLAAYLADSAIGTYDLEALIRRYLSVIPDLSVSQSEYLFRLYPVLKQILQASDQLNLLYSVEVPLSFVLAEMETTGFCVDRDAIRLFGEKLELLTKETEQKIISYAGRPFNINSPKQLGEVLFGDLQLPGGKKTKTGYSTNAEILEKLKPLHPIVEEILNYRQYAKLKSTYTDGLLKEADENGQIHTTFKQTGTATGRLSSAEPNLQNIPVRTELGREMRKFFIPRNQDYVILDADYSQIELRILAHIAKDSGMISAFQSGEDVHATTASAVFDVPLEEVTPELRKKAKAVNFGILYGMGAYSLSQDLNTSRASAQDYIDRYLSRFSGIDAYFKNTIKDAYADGYTTTLFGRRRYIPELSSTNKMLQHFGERVAMNSPIQGTAADIIKVAMIRVSERLKREKLDAHLILQVHDELILEANKNCFERAYAVLKEEMEHSFDCAVPLLTDGGVGDNWYEAKN